MSEDKQSSTNTENSLDNLILVQEVFGKTISNALRCVQINK